MDLWGPAGNGSDGLGMMLVLRSPIALSWEESEMVGDCIYCCVLEHLGAPLATNWRIQTWLGHLLPAKRRVVSGPLLSPS